MSYISVNVDISIDDFLNELTGREKEVLMQELANELGIDIAEAESDQSSHPAEEQYREALQKLRGSYSRLPAEEIDRIKTLADRYGRY